MYVLTPGVKHMPFDVWLADVIQDEGGIGTLAHQFDDPWELGMIDTNIKGETIFSENLHATHEAGKQTEFGVRLTLEKATHSFDTRIKSNKRTQIGMSKVTILNWS